MFLPLKIIVGLLWEHLDTLNIIAAIFGALLSTFQYVASWYISASISVMNLVSYFRQADYVEVVINSLLLGLHCYGVYKWSQRDANQTGSRLYITRVAGSEWCNLILGALLFSLSFYMLLQAIEYHFYTPTGKSLRSPLLSATKTTLLVVGQWLSARKKLENYFVWLLYNFLAGFYHYHYLAPPLYVKYFFYIPFCIYSYWVWRKEYNQKK